jgi:threonyl-tRNA synthetase
VHSPVLLKVKADFLVDDTFPSVSQIGSEMENLFDFLDKVYGKFGMELKFGLSTRNPKKFMGDLGVWDKAEQTLKDVLEKFQKGNWEIFPEDAAVCVLSPFSHLWRRGVSS